MFTNGGVLYKAFPRLMYSKLWDDTILDNLIWQNRDHIPIYGFWTQ